MQWNQTDPSSLKLLNAHWWYDPHPSPAMPGPLQVPPGVLTTRVPSTDAVTAPLEIVTCMCGERVEKCCQHARAACINTHTHTHTHTHIHTHTHTHTRKRTSLTSMSCHVSLNPGRVPVAAPLPSPTLHAPVEERLKQHEGSHKYLQ
jgi:hypothetical protein